MFKDASLNKAYPKLAGLADPLKPMQRELVGRTEEIKQVLKTMHRPELSNAILLGSAGSGKTALVQGVAKQDTKRVYLEVDPARMISEAGSAEQMASMLKAFFDEAEQYVKNEGQELVMFIDEFHQIVQLSDAAVEAIKPVLAASGTRGIRIIAATTNEEFHKHISSNLPLVERLQRINLSPADKATTISILAGMAQRYDVADQFLDDQIFQLIYEYTQRYMPASSQPRKSILVLDNMIGWHKFLDRPMNRELLADVLAESLGVNVNFKIDGAKVEAQLNERVFSQRLATASMARRLQLSVADFHDETRPMGSFLLTGSTGVGKTELTKQLARILFGDDQRHLIRFDMSEFALDSSMDLFREELTRKVWDLSHAVVLIDEVEKASPMVTRLLLQVLDDGKLSDQNGREVSFLNTYIVMTTNSGSEIYATIAQYEASDTGDGENLKKYEKLIRRSITETAGGGFPPELLGRIDTMVPFQPLSRETQRKIVQRKLMQLIVMAKVKHGVKLAMDERVLAYIVDEEIDTETNSGGARGAVAKLNSEVATAVAAFINANPGVRNMRVEVDGTMAHEDKSMLEGEGRIVVSEDARGRSTR